MINAIKEWVARHEEQIRSTYDNLHRRAEASWQEFETTRYLSSELERLGIRFETFDDLTGAVGYWGTPGEGPTIGLRADIDALYQLVDGEWRANHSCGHDAHMTMVLHAVECLMAVGFEPTGLIKIIFQPAEESGMGAQAILRRGIADDLDYLLGIHVRPIQEMAFGAASPAIYHGASALLRGKLQGVQAHGARPHLGINVADSVGAVIQAVNSIRTDPTVPASAKVTMIRAGGDHLNIIPDEAEFGVDLRAQTNEAMADLFERAEHAIRTAAAINRATVNLEQAVSMPAADPSVELEKLVGEAIAEALGEEALVAPPVTPGGEDFHFYKKSLPHLEAAMIGLGTGLTPGLHHPRMSFNLNALLNGVTILAAAVHKISLHCDSKKG